MPARRAPAPPRGGRLAARGALRAGFVVSAAVSVVLFTVAVLALNATGWDQVHPLLGFGLLVLLFVDAAGCLAMVVFDYSTRLPQARTIARTTMVSIIATILLDVAGNGFRYLALLYLFQLACLVWFHLSTVEGIDQHRRFRAPWEIPDDPERRGYIPLNFYNLFWVFVVASVAGLIVEIVYHAIKVGGYEDRAGLLWGPFSPIYGFGAMLMTIALNRWWRSSKLVIFVVAGTIGAAFEFVVSWIMEKAFGIVAWDYTGTFGSIQGRTNFAFFLAWGFLGLVWIKLLLPDVLKAVDAIGLRVRALVTILMAMFMLVNGVMTIITLDRWYGRQVGDAPTNVIESYVDTNYDDQYMSNRFQTMDLDPQRAERTG